MHAIDTTPHWIDSVPLPRFPKLDKDIEVDVAIVGGGITGITAAYLLKSAGRKVAVVERARCATIDTGHTSAHLTAFPDMRLSEIKRSFGADAARAVWDAGMAAIDQIAALIRKHGIPCDFAWVPGCYHDSFFEPSKGGAEAVEREAAAAAELGIRCEYIARFRETGVPALRFPNQAIFHPRKYLSALVRGIPGGGSHVFEHTSLDETEENPLALRCGDHRIRAGHLILATHTPLVGNTPMFKALMFQTKLALYTSYVVAGEVRTERMPEGLYWDTADPYNYLRVEQKRGRGYAILGGEDHKTGQETDTAAIYDRLEKKFLQLFPQGAIDHRWSGQVIETNDGLPFIGETADRQFAATGYAGNGMTFGTLGAMMAADRILTRWNPWKDLFDIHRAKVRGGTWSYLRENADYPYYLARDLVSGTEGDSLDALGRNEGRILRLDGRKVAAYRNAAGAVTLCSPVCTHLQCIVAWNNAEQTWDCPCHGSRFAPDGKVISGPAEEPLEKL